VVPNSGLQGIAFFEATVCLTLLVLFVHLKRDNAGTFYRLWLLGWVCLTISSFSELAMFYGQYAQLHVLVSGMAVAALALFFASVVQLTVPQNRLNGPMLWLAGVMALITCYYESKRSRWAETRWETSLLESATCLCAGWFLWRAANRKSGHGGKLLAGAFALLGLNNLDRPQWMH